MKKVTTLLVTSARTRNNSKCSAAHVTQPRISCTTPRSVAKTASTETLWETTWAWSRGPSCASSSRRGSASTLLLRSTSSIAGSRCRVIWDFYELDRSESSSFQSKPYTPLLHLGFSDRGHFFFFKKTPAHQERFDPDPQGPLPDRSGEGEKRSREGADKGGVEAKTGVWNHQQRLSQVGICGDIWVRIDTTSVKKAAVNVTVK